MALLLQILTLNLAAEHDNYYSWTQLADFEGVKITKVRKRLIQIWKTWPQIVVNMFNDVPEQPLAVR